MLTCNRLFYKSVHSINKKGRGYSLSPKYLWQPHTIWGYQQMYYLLAHSAVKVNRIQSASGYHTFLWLATIIHLVCIPYSLTKPFNINASAFCDWCAWGRQEGWFVYLMSWTGLGLYTSTVNHTPYELRHTNPSHAMGHRALHDSHITTHQYEIQNTSIHR